jgi:ATP-dependent helicase/nuclease subunit B
MTEPRTALYALPPGVDFPTQLVAGLRTRLAASPPEAMADVTLILNTERMRRRVREALVRRGTGFLPKLRLITEIGSDMAEIGLTAPISPLRRRLDLTVLLDKLLKTGTTAFPRNSLYDLADSLAALMDEMQGEGVTPHRIAALDVANHSAHWARTQSFLAIVAEVLAGDAPDAEARMRRAVETLVARWRDQPPPHPVILAGSTGSRGTTALLMQAVARLQGGAVVLPGYDFDLPPLVWDSMSDALTAEDHPQYRFRRLFDTLDAGPQDVQPWTAAMPPAPDRNRLISLSLRPAPVTDGWLADGPRLPDLGPATAEMTLIEAPSERAEAMAIALILRDAAERGIRAALISADRNLTRRVSAVLDRWGIRPDDSAGQPLPLSAPGRFLRHVAALMGRKLTADALLTLLKHPLCFSGPGRGPHLMLTRELELHLRRHGPAFPTAQSLADWASAQKTDHAEAWAARIGPTMESLQDVTDMALSAHVALHLQQAESLARGLNAEGAGALWDKAAGIEALAAVTELAREAETGCVLSPADYRALFTAVLQRREVRDAPQVHPGIMFWGTLEARVQGVDLAILGGLNDGIWPPQPPPDPWLNRQMRKEAGLLLPERRIGLSAHDYQQAVAAQRVVLTRPLRNADAETVPSRWLNRLTNLMKGLPDRGGPDALAAMQTRGEHWLSLAAALEAPTDEVRPATRPSPRPPVQARPQRLSLTEVSKLIRDPYAIYARHVLKLNPLDPLRPEPDPRLRGVVLHMILENFVRQSENGAGDREMLMRITGEALAAKVAWPVARAIWQARIDRAADAFIQFSAQTGGVPVLVEEKGAVVLPGLNFSLTGKPDRIDRMDDGRLHLIDYKTGTPPTVKQQQSFDKQLLLAACMAEIGGFASLGPAEVARITYVGVKGDLSEVPIDLEPGQLGKIWQDFQHLIERYARRSQGYTARRAMFETNLTSDYDHLSRHGEWDQTSIPTPEDVG